MAIERRAYEVVLPSGRRAVFVEPTVEELLQAQKAGDDTMVLARCLRRLDGKPVSYQELRGEGLNAHLELKDISTLQLVLADIALPSREELAAAKGSLRAVAG